MAWFRRNKKTAKKVHKARNSRKLDSALRAAGVNPDLAFCTTCNEWYNVNNVAAYDLHAH